MEWNPIFARILNCEHFVKKKKKNLLEKEVGKWKVGEEARVAQSKCCLVLS